MEFHFSPNSTPRRLVVSMGSLTQKNVSRALPSSQKYLLVLVSKPPSAKKVSPLTLYPKPLPHIRHRRTPEKLRRQTGQHAQVLRLILKTEAIAVLRPDGAPGSALFLLRRGGLASAGGFLFPIPCADFSADAPALFPSAAPAGFSRYRTISEMRRFSGSRGASRLRRRWSASPRTCAT